LGIDFGIVIEQGYVFVFFRQDDGFEQVIDTPGESQISGGGQQFKALVGRKAGTQGFQIVGFRSIIKHVHFVTGTLHALERLQARQGIGGVVPVEDEDGNAPLLR